MIAEYLLRGYLLKKLNRDEVRWRQKAIKMVSEKCRGLLKNFQFDIQYNYSRPDLFTSGKNYLMVCNHTSYMDIVMLSAGEPAVFVTSVEMKNTPFLGDLSSFGGSYFVERRDRNRIAGEVKDLAQILQQGFNVFVFPEATSTHGLHILPFKRALFTAAIEADRDVLPVCLRIEEIDGVPFQESNHARTSWYDKMEFFPHLAQFMSIKSLKVSVNYLEPISVRQFPDRFSLADQSYQQITQKYFDDRPPEFQPRPLPARKDKSAFADTKF